MNVPVAEVFEVIHRLAEPEPQRWPRLREGHRERIPQRTRVLVYQRDGFMCQHCGGSFDLQLDHIVPWSALGSDHSSNLRTLCKQCNYDRSNFLDPLPPRVVPVTEWCFWCVIEYYGGLEEDEIEAWNRTELERIPAYCGHCGTTSWVEDASHLL